LQRRIPILSYSLLKNLKGEIFALYNPQEVTDIHSFLEAKERVFEYDKKAYYFVKVPIVYNAIHYGNLTVIGSLEVYYKNR